MLLGGATPQLVSPTTLLAKRGRATYTGYSTRETRCARSCITSRHLTRNTISSENVMNWRKIGRQYLKFTNLEEVAIAFADEYATVR